MNRSTFGLVALLAAGPAFAAPDYPPGLFENSPVVPSGPPGTENSPVAPSGAPDAGVPLGPPSADGSEDDYCAGIESRTFRTLKEVRQAHVRCDIRGRFPPGGDHPPDQQ
jgi:hypothetical protein